MWGGNDHLKLEGINSFLHSSFMIIIASVTDVLLTFSLQNLSTLRTIILCISAIAIVLPLAMLRDIANLSSISVASLSFYACFLFYVSKCILLCIVSIGVGTESLTLVS